MNEDVNKPDPFEDEDSYEELRIKVDKGQQPLRIDKFLMNRLENVSRNRIQNALKAGSILINHKEEKPSYKVRPGDDITVILPGSPASTEVMPENIPLDIVYEDKYVMVINKPAGLVVHPGVGNYTGTLVNALAYHVEDLPEKSEGRPGIVHRLDKDTSGLLVIGKDEYSLSHLAKQFFNRTVRRRYISLVWGEPDNEGRIEGNIGRNQRFRKKMEVYPGGEEGKAAVTHYKLMESLYYVSLVECRLETGRTHQIRVHMKHIGHPVFNDKVYGGDSIVKGTVFTKYRQFVENCFKIMPRQALHAQSLGFIHPHTGKQLHFESDMPDDFQKLLDKWRRYIHAIKH